MVWGSLSKSTDLQHRVLDLIEGLLHYGMDPLVVDPLVDPEEVMQDRSYRTAESPRSTLERSRASSGTSTVPIDFCCDGCCYRQTVFFSI